MLRNDLIAARILKEYGHIISDEECKEIVGCVEDKKALAKAIMALGAPFNISEVDALSQIVGNLDQYDFQKDGHMWRDDVLDKYAEYVYNYDYQYNDEALKVDPTIDTEQQHTGPMAQDLEKVNPSVVTEDPKSGYKTVDTGRLALMNAGAIADLARKVQVLENENG